MRFRKTALVLSLFALLIVAALFAVSLLPVSAPIEPPPTTVVWIQKPLAYDYAWSGVPDFDQKQDNWNSTTVVSYTLFASNTAPPGVGWGFTSLILTNPGPTLWAVQGDTVNLTLASADGNIHKFHLDYNNNGIVDPGEPESLPFGAAPIVYTFTLTQSGKFTYRCSQMGPPPHPELGTFNVNSRRWTWCGPVAVANSLWWWDSHIDGWFGPNSLPPNMSDHFPLVQNYTPGIDDHDPANVMPFVQNLAILMQTDVGKSGTNVYDMQAGIQTYLEEKKLNMSFHEMTWPPCTFGFEDVWREFEKCEDVVLLLGFYEMQRDPLRPYDYIWVRVGGHYVTVAGVGNATELNQNWIKFSDPFLDYAEDMGWDSTYVPVSHPAHPGNSAVHNNATLVSHDPYKIIDPPTSPYPIPGIHFGIEGYNVSKIIETSGLYENGPGIPGVPNGSYQGGVIYTGVEYAVVFSPTQYEKPPYPEYAPSGVPDFDQKQDNWKNPITNKWSWCGPVALANSLWWFDSKFDDGTAPDGFPLVQNYGPWDDHDPRNVAPLIEELAYLADTDGNRTKIVHNGTYVGDLENATRWYFELKGLKDTFYERTWYCNFTFADVEYEVEKCEDVILLLGFYEWRDPPGVWVRLGGHYVTVIGVNASGEIKFSDPAIDNAEAGGRGQVLPPGHIHNPPGNTTLHNDAAYVSHDWYLVTPMSPIEGTHWGIEDYPGKYVSYDVNGANQSEPWQSGSVFTAVEYAVVISPSPAAPPPLVHDVKVLNVKRYCTKENLDPITEGYKTWTINVSVKVENQGNYTETFNVTANYENTTGRYAIGTKPVNNLAPGTSTTVNFTWKPDASVQTCKTYTISANASIVLGETNTTNNYLADGTVKIKYAGDASNDNFVDVDDLQILGWSWQLGVADIGYRAQADFSFDAFVDVDDLQILGWNWQQGC